MELNHGPSLKNLHTEASIYWLRGFNAFLWIFKQYPLLPSIVDIRYWQFETETRSLNKHKACEQFKLKCCFY